MWYLTWIKIILLKKIWTQWQIIIGHVGTVFLKVQNYPLTPSDGHAYVCEPKSLSIENPPLKSQVSDGNAYGNPNHKALKTHHLKSATPIGGRVPIEIKPATPICC